MKKIIKFRAWDGEKMYDWDYLKRFTSNWLDNDDREGSFKPMQFTGLKDKNGTEIYEGDIVGQEGVYHFLDREGWKPSGGSWKIIGEKSKDFTKKGEEKYIAGYQLRTVEWKESSCGFEPFSDSEDNCGHCGCGDRPSDYEVLGNIYENPELLKESSL